MFRFICSLTFFLSLSSVCLQACPFASGHKTFKRPNAKQSLALVENPKEVRSALEHLSQEALEKLRIDFEEEGYCLDAELKKLKSLSSSSSAKELTKCLEALFLDPSLSKMSYSKFVQHLREAVTLTQKNQDSLCELAQELSRLHFQIDFSKEKYDYFNSFFSKDYSMESIENVKVSLLNQKVNQLYSKVSVSFWKKWMSRKIHQMPFFTWDPTQLSVRSKIADERVRGRSISILRMGCPVLKTPFSMKVDPLFISYLNALKKRGEKHLYINHQNTERGGYEQKASFELSKLQEAFPETFYFITLPYNSAFYEQSNQGRVYATHFLKNFLTYMEKNQQGFFFPQKWRDDSSFKEELKELLKSIHETYFNGCEFLVQRERGQFIDLAYAHLAAHFIEKLQVQKVNWTCRHGIDRAMSALTVFDALAQTLENKAYSIQKALFFSYWPALTYYHRAPQAKRVVRTLSALEKFSNKQKEPY